MRIIAMLLMLVLCACGRQEIQPDFLPYIEHITSDLNRHGRTLIVSSSIQFGTANAGAGATCFSNWGKSSRIIIDKDNWDEITDSDRYWLLVHEIGHCEYGLGHTDSWIEQGNFRFPSHVMHWNSAHVAFAASTRGKKDFYLKQLIESSPGAFKAQSHQHSHD